MIGRAAAVLGAAAATGGLTYVLMRRSGQVHLQKTLQEADKDWRARTSERDISPEGRLAAIFNDSGWSRYGVDRYETTGRPKDWCGMSVAAWAYRAGLLKDHRPSMWHTEGVRSFFSYTRVGNTHRRTATEVRGRPVEQWHTSEGKRRRWVETDELRAIPMRELPLKAGDVVLISHSGSRQRADHIALVSSWDAERGLLGTIEGNASGYDPDGRAVRDQVIRKSRDLSSAEVRNTLFGVGRFSPLDFG